MAEIVSPKSGKLIKVNSKQFRDLQSNPRYSDSILTENKENSSRVTPSFKRSLLPTLSPIAPVVSSKSLPPLSKPRSPLKAASPILSASPSLDLSGSPLKVQESIPYPKGLPALAVTSNSPVATRVKSPVATRRVLPPLHVSPKDLGTLAPSPRSPKSPKTSLTKSPKVFLPPLSPKKSPQAKPLPLLSPKNIPKANLPKLSPKSPKTKKLPPLSPKSQKLSPKLSRSPKTKKLPPLSPKSQKQSKSPKKSPTTKLPPLKLTSAQLNKRNERSRGWRELSPKPGPERKELKETCGNACFLRPEDNGYPICRKLQQGEASCQVEKKGVKAALSRARQQGEEKVEFKAEVILNKMEKMGIERVRLPALNRNSTLAAKHTPQHVPVIGSPKRYSRSEDSRNDRESRDNDSVRLPGLPSPLQLGKISPSKLDSGEKGLEEIKTSSCGCGQ